MRRLRLALAALAASGCSVIFPTGDYMNPLPIGEADGGDAGAVDAASTCGGAMPVPADYDPSQLVFEDAFCRKVLDANKWLPYMPGFNNNGHLQLPRSGPNAGGFEAEYFDPLQVTVGNGLRLTTVRDETVQGYTAKSGVLTTPPTVKFGGGPTGHTYLQVRAKIPATDGMWARVYLGPLVGVTATPVGFVSTGFKDVFTGTPLTNFQSTVGDANKYIDTGVDQSKGFSDYGVEIAWGQSVTWFWNAVGSARQQVRQVPAGASVTIPTSADGETLFIALAVVNGQDGSSGWHTVWNGSDADALTIAEVQVYAR